MIAGAIAHDNGREAKTTQRPRTLTRISSTPKASSNCSRKTARTFLRCPHHGSTAFIPNTIPCNSWITNLVAALSQEQPTQPIRARPNTYPHMHPSRSTAASPHTMPPTAPPRLRSLATTPSTIPHGLREWPANFTAYPQRPLTSPTLYGASCLLNEPCKLSPGT